MDKSKIKITSNNIAGLASYMLPQWGVDMFIKDGVDNKLYIQFIEKKSGRVRQVVATIRCSGNKYDIKECELALKQVILRGVIHLSYVQEASVEAQKFKRNFWWRGNDERLLNEFAQSITDQSFKDGPVDTKQFVKTFLDKKYGE